MKTKFNSIRSSLMPRGASHSLGTVAVAATFLGVFVSLLSLTRVSEARPAPPGSVSVVSHEHHEKQGSDIKFGPAPSVFPPGAEMAVLQGDPSVAGAIFTVRLRMPSGYVIPAHWHPTDENVTVISGTFLVGIGDRYDRAKLLPPLRAGGFITAPANVNHFATVKGLTVVQVHAIGPFQMTFVDPQKRN
jgi:quercetin dioxygenase-like cupin family protein